MKLISELFWGWKANYLWHGTQWIGSVWKVWLELPSWRRSWKAHEEVPNWFANHDLKSFWLAFFPSTHAPIYLQGTWAKGANSAKQIQMWPVCWGIWIQGFPFLIWIEIYCINLLYTFPSMHLIMRLQGCFQVAQIAWAAWLWAL